MELFGEGLQALAQKHHLRGLDAQFPLFGAKHLAFNADQVAYIHLFEIRIGVIADYIPADIELNGTTFILQVRKAGLSHNALTHHAPCNGDDIPTLLLRFQSGMLFTDIGRMAFHRIAGNCKGIAPLLLQFQKLVPADL